MTFLENPAHCLATLKSAVVTETPRRKKKARSETGKRATKSLRTA